MYFVSNERVGNNGDEMYIIDGQNTTQIQQYIDNGQSSDPCIPPSFTTRGGDVTITFDPNFIQSMNNWYPSNVCGLMTYDNAHIFDALYQNLTINNLIINDYIITQTNNYLLMRMGIGVISITCNNCIFRNISSSKETQFTLFGTLFDIGRYATDRLEGDIIFINSTFKDITITSNSPFFTLKVTNALFHGTKFENISAATSIIELIYGDLLIKECEF